MNAKLMCQNACMRLAATALLTHTHTRAPKQHADVARAAGLMGDSASLKKVAKKAKTARKHKPSD